MTNRTFSRRNLDRFVGTCMNTLMNKEKDVNSSSVSPLLCLASGGANDIPHTMSLNIAACWQLAQMVIEEERFPNGVSVNATIDEIVRVHGETANFFIQKLTQFAPELIPEPGVVVVPVYGVVVTDDENVGGFIAAFNRKGISACRPKDAAKIGKELLCKTTSR